MTARLFPASRAPFQSIDSWILALVLMTFGLFSCSSEEAGTRSGNVRLTIQQGANPPDIDMGEVDTLMVSILDATTGQVDSTHVISPMPASTGGVIVIDLEIPSAADRALVVRGTGERPVAGAAVATWTRGVLWRGVSESFDIDVGGMTDVNVQLTPFVSAFQAVQFMDDGARYRLYWNRVSQATRWRLSIREGSEPAVDTLLSDTTFASSQLPASYQVRPLDAALVAGAPSDILQPGRLLPGVPVNLRLTPRRGERMDVRWSTGGGSVTAWELERLPEESGFEPLVTLAVDTTLFADTTVVDGRRFEYRVRARNSRGVSGWSTTVGAVTPLNTPTDLVATGDGLEIALGWTDRSQSETGYELERARGSGSFEPLVMRPVNASGWVDAPLAENTRYRYRIRAVRGLLVSPWSAIVESTTPMLLPSSPGGLLAQPITPTQINLGWGPARGIVAQYEIERRLPGQDFANHATVSGDVVVFADLGLAPSTTLEYRVRARNETGPGAWSNVASATTFPAPR